MRSNFARVLLRQIAAPAGRQIAPSSVRAASSGSAPDSNPGTKIPEGPSRSQPATQSQKDFAAKVANSPAVDEPLKEGATKGEASDYISDGLEAAKQASPRGGTGAAEDTTPGEKKPTGPSAKQPATGNQKQFAERLSRSGNVDSTLPPDATKGQASEYIEDALNATKK